MKSSVKHLSLELLVGLFFAVMLPACACAQNAGSADSPPSACAQPPCSTVSCGAEPCNQDGRPASMATGRQHSIPPMTPERRARIELEMRYGGLFGHLEAQEKLAQYYDAQGNSVAAASWRADFARKSGLTPEEAETVKKIAAQYRKDQISLNAQCRADLVAMRETFAAEHAAGEKYSAVPSCDALRTLFPKVMADLLAALGSRSFSRLDAYATHRLDNARKLYPGGAPTGGQRGEPPEATQKETPQ